MTTFAKIKPNQMIIDFRYQRDFDEQRAKVMGENIDLDRIGVPVVSVRKDGVIAVIDAQHRVAALRFAGLGDSEFLCEVHEGLSLKQEAALFLKLNGGRKAVRVYDRFKARIVSNERVAVDINKIVQSVGIKIQKAPGAKYVCAIQALESVYHRKGNLERVLRALLEWGDRDPKVFDGDLIRAFGSFFAAHPDAVDSELVKRLLNYSPDRVLSKFKSQLSLDPDMQRETAYIAVIRGIYNHKNKNRLTSNGSVVS